MDEKTRHYWAQAKDVPAYTITDADIERWIAEIRTASDDTKWFSIEEQNTTKPQKYLLTTKPAMLIIDLVTLCAGILVFGIVDAFTNAVQHSLFYGFITVVGILVIKIIILLIDSVVRKRAK